MNYFHSIELLKEAYRDKHLPFEETPRSVQLISNSQLKSNQACVRKSDSTEVDSSLSYFFLFDFELDRKR